MTLAAEIWALWASGWSVVSIYLWARAATDLDLSQWDYETTLWELDAAREEIARLKNELRIRTEGP